METRSRFGWIRPGATRAPTREMAAVFQAAAQRGALRVGPEPPPTTCVEVGELTGRKKE